MPKNPQEYYEYYDDVFLDKNYRQEATAVLDIAEKYLGNTPKKIIDIGCGTGRHDFIFAEKGHQILGIDTDCPIIELAKAKIPTGYSQMVEFRCQEIKHVPETGFNLATALFNVVNYIEKPDDLFEFFYETNQRLENNGIFIFDCWNGIAAIIDNPKEKSSRIETNGNIIDIISHPTIDLMNQIVKMNNQVSINSQGKKIQYNFKYNSTLWTPWTLKNILIKSGFKVQNICSWMNLEKNADHKDWKITFICQKNK